MIQKFTVEELIPIPHDCVISKISLEHDHMIFTFENRLFNHESIQKLHPSADSLIMRFHLTRYSAMDVCRLYVRKKGRFHDGYRLLRKETLPHLAKRKRRLEYLYHYVGAREMIIHLGGEENYVLYVCADSVEYNWIESQQFIAT